MMNNFVKRFGIFKILIVSLIILILLFCLVIWRLDSLMNTFDSMCFYEYPDDYKCSCQSNKQFNGTMNLSESINITILYKYDDLFISNVST